MKEYNIKVTSANIAQDCDTSIYRTCCSCGNCVIRLEDGVVLNASYDDTMSGDDGARWEMTITCGAESWSLHVDEISTDADHNVAVKDALESRFGVNADILINQIKRAIGGAALIGALGGDIITTQHFSHKGIWEDDAEEDT